LKKRLACAKLAKKRFAFFELRKNFNKKSDTPLGEILVGVSFYFQGTAFASVKNLDGDALIGGDIREDQPISLEASLTAHKTCARIGAVKRNNRI